MADTAQPTLDGLAAEISALSKTITSYLKDHDLPAPSFAADSPGSYPTAPEVQLARVSLLGKLADIGHLATGVVDQVFTGPMLAYPWSS